MGVRETSAESKKTEVVNSFKEISFQLLYKRGEKCQVLGIQKTHTLGYVSEYFGIIFVLNIQTGRF